MSKETVKRIEQAFNFYEESSLMSFGGFKSATIEIPALSKAVSAFEVAPEFRTYLARSFGTPLDIKKFVIGATEQAKPLSKLSFCEHFPMAMHAWVNSSRRVYRLSDSIRDYFDEVSLAGVGWLDINWPFNSFAVQFDTPINFEEHSSSIDCVIIYRASYEGVSYICCLAMDSGLGNLTFYSPEKREKMLWAIKKNHWHKYHRLMSQNAYAVSPFAYPLIPMWMPEDKFKCLRGDVSNEMFQRESAHPDFGSVVHGVENRDEILQKDYVYFLSIYRLVVALCLYLQTKPSRESTDVPRPKNDEIDPDHLTYGSDVLVVSTGQGLSETVSESDGKTGRTLPAHFRSGYYRRPFGMGKDPNCPKTVWVKPTIVNRSQLPVGKIPGGVEQVL
ncbi:MAG: hypothetical protein WC457_04065 [Patescibacteria group bacterium]